MIGYILSWPWPIENLGRAVVGHGPAEQLGTEPFHAAAVNVAQRRDWAVLVDEIDSSDLLVPIETVEPIVPSRLGRNRSPTPAAPQPQAAPLDSRERSN